MFTRFKNIKIPKDFGFYMIFFMQLILLFMMISLYFMLPAFYGDWDLNMSYNLNGIYILMFISTSVYLSSLTLEGRLPVFEETLSKPITWAYIALLLFLSIFAFSPLFASTVIFIQAVLIVQKLDTPGGAYPLKLKLGIFDYLGRPLILSTSIYATYVLVEFVWRQLDNIRLSSIPNSDCIGVECGEISFFVLIISALPLFFLGIILPFILGVYAPIMMHFNLLNLSKRIPMDDIDFSNHSSSGITIPLSDIMIWKRMSKDRNKLKFDIVHGKLKLPDYLILPDVLDMFPGTDNITLMRTRYQRALVEYIDNPENSFAVTNLSDAIAAMAPSISRHRYLFWINTYIRSMFQMLLLVFLLPFIGLISNILLKPILNKPEEWVEESIVELEQWKEENTKMGVYLPEFETISKERIGNNFFDSTEKYSKLLRRFRLGEENPIFISDIASDVINFQTSKNQNSRNIADPKTDGVLFTNFPCLGAYPIPDKIKKAVEEFTISDDKKSNSILKLIPKAELHAHIGGIIDIESQKKAGEIIWSEMNEDERLDRATAVEELLVLAREKGNPKQSVWPPNWSSKFIPKSIGAVERAQRASVLLSQLSSQQLENVLFPSSEDCWKGRVQMKVDGFESYPMPGDLMGSTLLAIKNNEVLREYSAGIVRYCKSDMVKYIEIRMSPQKYRIEIKEQKKFLIQLSKQINSAMKRENYDFIYRFIISGDRISFSKPNGRFIFDSFRELLLEIDRDLITRNLVVGFDIAGSEEEGDLPEFILSGARNIQKLTSLQFTLHAGEQSTVANLWDAIDTIPSRIGHGLKFEDDKKLFEHFKTRGIVLEMCPTSNIEVHGFTGLPEISGTLPKYPLKLYLEKGIKVAICTDNPFISRTNSTQELVRASLMSGGLQLTTILSIIFCGFDSSFLQSDEKNLLISQIDSDLRRVLESHFNNIIHNNNNNIPEI